MLVTTAVAGSPSGVTFIRSVRSMMMSAFLPGVSDPTLPSRPLALAPSMVAYPRTSRADTGALP